MFEVSAEESAVTEEPVYEWDFQKNCPVYVGVFDGDTLPMEYPNYDPYLHSIAGALSDTDVLFHVTITPSAYIQYMLSPLSGELAKEAGFEPYVKQCEEGICLTEKTDTISQLPFPER